MGKIPILTNIFQRGWKPPTRYGIYWLGKKYCHMGIYRVYIGLHFDLYVFSGWFIIRDSYDGPYFNLHIAIGSIITYIQQMTVVTALQGLHL